VAEQFPISLLIPDRHVTNGEIDWHGEAFIDANSFKATFYNSPVIATFTSLHDWRLVLTIGGSQINVPLNVRLNVTLTAGDTLNLEQLTFTLDSVHPAPVWSCMWCAKSFGDETTLEAHEADCF
jgi:hypothetical protein